MNFAVIIVSADLLLAVTAAAVIVTSHLSGEAQLIGAGVLLASVIAVLLGYYSICVGSCLSLGPLYPSQLVLSFLIAADQIALFLVPIYAFQTKPHRWAELSLHLRWWSLAAAAFCVLAVAANFNEAGLRAARLPESIRKTLWKFESLQRLDRRLALVAAGALGVIFGISFADPRSSTTLVITATLLAVLMMTGALLSQSRTIAELEHAILCRKSHAVDRPDGHVAGDGEPLNLP